MYDNNNSIFQGGSIQKEQENRIIIDKTNDAISNIKFFEVAKGQQWVKVKVTKFYVKNDITNLNLKNNEFKYTKNGTEYTMHLTPNQITSSNIQSKICNPIASATGMVVNYNSSLNRLDLTNNTSSFIWLGP